MYQSLKRSANTCLSLPAIKLTLTACSSNPDHLRFYTQCGGIYVVLYIIQNSSARCASASASLGIKRKPVYYYAPKRHMPLLRYPARLDP